MKTNMLIKIAIIAALYVVVTLFLTPSPYLGIQFRFAEILNLLAFLNPVYGIGVIIGCFLSNLNSPLGIIDIIFGTFATALSVFLIGRSKNLLFASFYPVIINAIIVGFELFFVLKLPLFLSMLQVGIGEFLVVTIAGYALFTFILKDERLLKILKYNKNKFQKL